MSKIEEQNAEIRKKLLQQNPNGINLILAQENPTSQIHQEEVHKMLAAVKRVTAAPKKQKKVAISPMTALQFSHQSEAGLQWEQSYQYVNIATCRSSVIKASYHLKFDFTCRSTFALQSKTQSLLMPIKVMEPARPQRAPKTPDLTSEIDLPSKAQLKQLLVYPSLSSVGAPNEIKPIVLPAAHFKHERLQLGSQSNPNAVAEQEQPQKGMAMAEDSAFLDLILTRNKDSKGEDSMSIPLLSKTPVEQPKQQ